ncbi:MAG: pantoate--beta-alanine ligase, partial [Bdellovibrionaceae bacterium]|jgi:pantoate--beta-alanine ligase|nr:pantoate--beta-alanine ligase [Pseudobdellovibrionaceae bacterium]
MSKISVLTSPQEWQKLCYSLRSSQATTGFIPTMGALHAGHLELVRRSLQENEHSLISIYVNPTQFNQKEDFERYPRLLQSDLDLLADLSSPLYVFAPSDPYALYPDNYRYQVVENEISQILCGAHRPGHFQGMLTVVMKLLLLTMPTRAYFGEKDFQQLELVKGLVEAFFIPTQIVPAPTVRDSSGLALSSRLKRLSPAGLEKARHIYPLISTVTEIEDCRRQLTELGFQVEYLEHWQGRRFVALWIEGVRLIDHVPWPPSNNESSPVKSLGRPGD